MLHTLKGSKAELIFERVKQSMPQKIGDFEFICMWANAANVLECRSLFYDFH